MIISSRDASFIFTILIILLVVVLFGWKRAWAHWSCKWGCIWIELLVTCKPCVGAYPREQNIWMRRGISYCFQSTLSSLVSRCEVLHWGEAHFIIQWQHFSDSNASATFFHDQSLFTNGMNVFFISWLYSWSDLELFIDRINAHSLSNHMLMIWWQIIHIWSNNLIIWTASH